MKICYFGTYDKEDSRNAVIIDGLRKNNVDVIECHSSVLSSKYPWMNPVNYMNLIRKFYILKSRDKFDVVIVGFSMIGSFIDILLIKLLTKKTIIFNPLVSLYGTLVLDRKMVRHPILISILCFIEKIAYMVSDVIMIDTNLHIMDVCKNIGISNTKFKRIFVGADTSVFHPREMKEHDDTFTVLFFGFHSPLHGIEYIVKAAKILENKKDIKFIIVGNGQVSNQIRELALRLKVKNILFIEWVEDLVDLISRVDICLGIFGNTEKAKYVIPKKAFETLAMKKPLITGNSPAMEEIFINRETAILCDMANSESLASSIVLLKENPKLREKISDGGHRLFTSQLTPEKIGEEVLKLCLRTPEI